MAAKIRRLGLSAAYLLVAWVALMPFLGIVFGLWPQHAISLGDIVSFLKYKGLISSIGMTLFTAIFSTLISLYIAFMVFSQFHGSAAWQSLEKYLAPLLALPHLAIALGLVFLFSHGGLFFDTGLPRKNLLTLIMAIVIKEVPFFLLVLSAIGRQLPIKAWLTQGNALGYRLQSCWWLLIFPPLLQQARLALLAASAYTLSVVDIGALVGPNIPELFAVSMYRWQTSFSSLDQSMGFMANVLLISLMVLLVLILGIHEKLIVLLCRYRAIIAKGLRLAKMNRIFVVWLPLSAVLTLLMVWVFALWSLGGDGQWHQATLTGLQFDLWKQEWFFYRDPLQNSILIGVIAAMLGVVFALMALTLQRRHGYYLPDALWLMGILLPQLSMVLGWQIMHIWVQGEYHFGWIAISHLPFTFAYGYLVLKGPFQSIDPHYELLASSYGYSPWQLWYKVRIPLLLPPIFTAFAICFSVSIAQYIPTLMIGAGRVTTITTEAVAIGTGGQQDIMALYMLLQSCLPFAAFFMAALLAQYFRGRADVQAY